MKRLVCFECHDEIQRETNIKRWPREWRINLITKENPASNDLHGQML